MAQLQPFEVRVADEALADLRAGLAATRWIEDAFEGDWRFGTPRPFLRALCERWRNGFDWRGLEARLNREAHVTTAMETPELLVGELRRFAGMLASRQP